MNILLANDDGYNQPGILLLKKILQDYGNVYICAPHEHQSGASMSFSLGKGFKVIKHDETTYSINGSPVDVVLLGLQILPIKFDLVVSGCNSGHNISYDTMYSGTIGAALEALNHGIPSIAFSTDYDHWEVVENDARMVLDFIFKNKLISNKYMLNVNFPKYTFNKSKGIKITKEFFKNDQFYYEVKDGLYYTDRYENLNTDDKDSDVYAIANGYISICPITNSYFKQNIYEEMKKVVG